MVGGWLVEQFKDGAAQIIAINFRVRLGLTGELSSGAHAVELVPVFTDEGFAYTQKSANRLAGNFSVACQGYHRAVSIRQPTIVEVLQQNRKLWNTVKLSM